MSPDDHPVDRWQLAARLLPASCDTCLTPRYLDHTTGLILAHDRAAGDGLSQPCEGSGQLPGAVVAVPLSRHTAHLLEVLADPASGLTGYSAISAVLSKLADFAQQGVDRPASWERPWLTHAFGDEWLGRLDPGSGGLHGSHQRPRLRDTGPAPGAAP